MGKLEMCQCGDKVTTMGPDWCPHCKTFTNPYYVRGELPDVQAEGPSGPSSGDAVTVEMRGTGGGGSS